jgi:hypothetical protein
MKPLFGVALATVVLASPIQTTADQAISLTVRPKITTYRGNAQVRVLVSRDEKNRTLVWEVDGPNYYRSSSVELQGATSPRSYFFLARDLPSGEFEVRATVKRNDRSTARAVSSLRVVGGPE